MIGGKLPKKRVLRLITERKVIGVGQKVYKVWQGRLTRLGCTEPSWEGEMMEIET